MITIRRYLGVIGLFAAALLAPHAAHATGEKCVNDIDCKTGPTCGGEICDWNMAMTCQPATAAGSGQEGWCTVDSDCKCKAQGATCNKTMFQCTKTTDAAGAGGASGSAGAGSSAAGSSAAGSSSAGTSSSSGSSSSGGCSLAGGIPRGSLGLTLGAVCAAALIGARRRRRAA